MLKVLLAAKLLLVAAINTDPCNSNIRLATQQNGGILTSSSDSCYLLLTAKLVWAEAERNCNVYGGYLLEIDDQTEQTLIQHFLQRYDSTQAVWLGLHDQTKEGSFVWTTGEIILEGNILYPPQSSK